MIKRFPQLKPAHYVAAAHFLFFIIPLLRGRTIFWGLPALQFIPWRHYAWMLLRDRARRAAVERALLDRARASEPDSQIAGGRR